MSSNRSSIPIKLLIGGAIKSAIHHLRWIVQELENIDMALQADQIGAQQAIDLVHEIAPGLIGYLSPLCGLRLPRNPDAAPADRSGSEAA